MKRFTKKFTKMLSAALAGLTVVSACALYTAPSAGAAGLRTAAEKERMSAALTAFLPISNSPSGFTIPVNSAPGTTVKSNAKATIDYSNAKNGYVMIKYMNTTTKKLIVKITTPGGVDYQYSLKQNATYEVYPFSEGSGKYKITVYENVEGKRYTTALTAEVDVRLANEFVPFLRPSQHVNYTKDSETVEMAAELCEDAEDTMDSITAAYNYVVQNFKYDNALAASVQSGYLPDVDAVLEKKKGICFDYAAVLTAMLRSQGIPTKLVKGYAGDVYHAWIDVYTEEEGWITNAIHFDGEEWELMDPTFASTGKSSASVMKYIGDGSNYSVSYMY